MANTGAEKLQKLLRYAKNTLLALKVELREEEEERESPIALTGPANDLNGAGDAPSLVVASAG